MAAIDPRHDERRYRKALRDRTVCAWLDENGTAVLHARGLTPAQAQAGLDRIDLLAHATLLAELRTQPAGHDRAAEPATDSTVAAWAGVLADIAHQYGDRDRRDLDAHPHDRLPRAALRRHTRIRDRTCLGPGCRHRPTRCDQDHTIEHQHGGETVAADLGPLCRHDHGLKAHGWALHQPAPGTFLWISPLGGRYPVHPEPVLPPLPDPRPGPDGPRHDDAAPPGPDALIMDGPDPPPPQVTDDPD